MANHLCVAVLTHEFDEFPGDGYLLSRLCPMWQDSGIDVAIVRGLTDQAPAADVAVLHANMTVIPPEYLESARRYPIVINGAATDISKRRVSEHIVSGPNATPGPVIVKTNANYGGRPEARHAMLRGENKGGPQQPSWENARSLVRYSIFRSSRDVPPAVWNNPHLVVDRFLPERNAAGEFVLRIWIFLGDRSLHYSCISREPIIKSSNTLRREQLDRDDIPEELRRRRSELGFDYGKFDYVQINGKAHLIDANKTPGLVDRDDSNPENAAKFRHLSEGLKYFLADRHLAASDKVNP